MSKEDIVTMIVSAVIGLAIGFAIVFASNSSAFVTPFQLMDIPTINPTGLRTSPFRVKNQMYKIGIIDTGYNKGVGGGLKLCPTGHYDFNTEKSELGFTQPHGTIVGNIIADELQDVNYCAVIYQVDSAGGISPENIRRALKMATKEGLVALNMSLEGPTYVEEERLAFVDLGRKGTTIFVAAGNAARDLDSYCTSYPTCYNDVPNLHAIGASDELRLKASYSNYGQRIWGWHLGTAQFANRRVQGTSFASPRALADFVFAHSQRLQLAQ